MLGKKRQRRKLNNHGMSLVEVLVAMIIISVAGVAFLQSFANASRYNARAKQKQYALYLAQGIMEDFKAVSMEKMDEKFSNGTSSFPQYTMTGVSGDYSSGYNMSGVEFGGNKYDVSVEVSAATSPHALEEYQGQMIEAMNPVSRDETASKDGFFREPLEAIEVALKRDAYNQLYQLKDAVDPYGDEKYPGLKDYLDTIDYSFIPDSVIHVTDRQIAFSFHEVVGTTKTRIDVNETVEYSISGFKYLVYNEETDSEDEVSVEDVINRFDGSGTLKLTLPGYLDDDLDPSGEFRSAFVCYESDEPRNTSTYRLLAYYYPLYSIFGNSNLVGTEYTRDRIFINSDLIDNPFEVFLIKQNVLDGTSTKFSGLSTCEAEYSAFIEKQGSGNVSLFTNLMDKFTDTPNILTGYDKRVPIVGFNESLGYNGYKDQHGNVFCFGFGSGYNMSDTTTGLWYNDSSEQQVLLYNIKIVVCLDGDEIYVLEGSTNKK